MRVIHGGAQGPRRTALEDAYDHFRLERQGNRVSPKTLLAYDYHLGPFFDWLRRELGRPLVGSQHPGKGQSRRPRQFLADRKAGIVRTRRTLS
jgi:hypothetical protein